MTASLLFFYIPGSWVLGEGMEWNGMEGEGKYVMLLLEAKKREEWEDERERERERESRALAGSNLEDEVKDIVFSNGYFSFF
ncbi:hypothetical protein EYC80_001694 [Monilinia laxa]|uniref:Uncharacterized protein n=1 Tax=Monilinia laxa TaxID=61186 RepID=A0A5N6K5U5_MONLA|nr:hypothetical protein EYC80_001694 [Monilinia laxa]